MWFKNLSGRMGQNLRNLSKLTEKHYNLNSIVRLRIRLSVCTGKRIYIAMLAAKISRVKSL